MLIKDIFNRIDRSGAAEFSVKDLFSESEWSSYSVQERRGVGRATIKKVVNGGLNKDGWIVKPIQDTNPQRYRKYRQEVAPIPEKKTFLNEIPDIEQPLLRDLIKILDANGIWLKFIEKPQRGKQ